jgi:hypothetical protein
MLNLYLFFIALPYHLQLANGEKMKTMNKKQLRQIKKTRMAANGAIELVDVYNNDRKGKKK